MALRLIHTYYFIKLKKDTQSKDALADKFNSELKIGGRETRQNKQEGIGQRVEATNESQSIIQSQFSVYFNLN